MTTCKKDEHRRNYRLRAEGCQHQIDTINDEHAITAAASDDWTRTIEATRSRLDALKSELFQAARDRRTPAVIQKALRDRVYAALRELAAPAFIDKILKPKGRRCSRG